MAITKIQALRGYRALRAELTYIIKNKPPQPPREDSHPAVKIRPDPFHEGQVVYPTLTTTHNCIKATGDLMDNYKLWLNTYGRFELDWGNARSKNGEAVVGWILIQNFGVEMDPVEANEIGLALVKELFPSHTAIISTHSNTDYIHNHILISAWNMDAGKYNNDHAAYQRIREVSDRLCREHGLPVLEETEQVRLVRWKDKNGKTHYYEPTDRKNEKIRERSQGSWYNVDISHPLMSYKNEQLAEEKFSRAYVVKGMIDTVLPLAVSYEHLLELLDEWFAITVKDKKKDGNWKEPALYYLKGSLSGVKDITVDPEGRYTRKSLMEQIDQRNREREEQLRFQQEHQIPTYDGYHYGKTKLQELKDDYRADYGRDDFIWIYERGELERQVLGTIKEDDRELCRLYDTSTLQRLIRQQELAALQKKPPEKRADVLIREIQDSFALLRFIEEQRIWSYEDFWEEQEKNERERKERERTKDYYLKKGEEISIDSEEWEEYCIDLEDVMEEWEESEDLARDFRRHGETIRRIEQRREQERQLRLQCAQQQAVKKEPVRKKSRDWER